MSDRIKQTLPASCLDHVLSTEGIKWFRPDKLTTVVDTYLNSHSSSPRGYTTAYKGAQANMGIGAAKIPAVSKPGSGAYAYTGPQAKPIPLMQTPTNNSAPIRCFRFRTGTEQRYVRQIRQISHGNLRNPRDQSRTRPKSTM